MHRPEEPLWPAATPHVAVPAEPEQADDAGDHVAWTNGRALARATASSLQRSPDGLATVVFAPQSAQPSAPSVARAVNGHATSNGSVPAAVAAPATAASATPTAAPPAAEPPLPGRPAADIDVDSLYEQMLERLRRDLVVERERVGDLVRDPSWGI